MDETKLLAARTGCELVFMAAHPLDHSGHGGDEPIPHTSSFFAQAFDSVDTYPEYNSQEANTYQAAQRETEKRLGEGDVDEVNGRREKGKGKES
ncbi:hypothetical protein L202_03699 [Cryptococcus amylolentus CBS 6039]|uniref:Uncharacterized protein n=2 Tax=Cryptococcus amylolentus TaxID=104669 RepID=A0A1E3HTX3_9TREE|nr:hypothetical protein L202_03699 [Cryptococcus amylolentus CBS 6039]ODN79797.1 hypothetical protein L202_03699 [Cryptococcus amylolentus CBS 6039]